MTTHDRFWAKVVQAPGGCLLWTGASVPAGYGQLRVDGRPVYAHRWSYETFVGPIPDGHQVDHLCRNRACVNSAHLEAVSLATNVLRGVGITAENARKTHCSAGHPLSGPNLYVNPSGQRKCRCCKAESRKRRRSERASL